MKFLLSTILVLTSSSAISQTKYCYQKASYMGSTTETCFEQVSAPDQAFTAICKGIGSGMKDGPKTSFKFVKACPKNYKNSCKGAIMIGQKKVWMNNYYYKNDAMEMMKKSCLLGKGKWL